MFLQTFLGETMGAWAEFIIFIMLIALLFNFVLVRVLE